MKYEEKFIAWLYTQYPIGNDDMLIHYMEDGVSYDNFLQTNNLIDEGE